MNLKAKIVAVLMALAPVVTTAQEAKLNLIPLPQKIQENNGVFVIDNNVYKIFYEGRDLGLTLKEFKILCKLCAHPGRVYTRDKLLDELWGIDYAGDLRTVDTHVARLRTKLGDWGTKYIKTVYGTGYKLAKNDD